MALVLTSYQAYGIEPEEGLNGQRGYVQKLIIAGTGAGTDLVHDVGDFTAGSLGTFWAAVDGTATGLAALGVIQDIALRADNFVSMDGVKKVLAAAVASGVAALAYDATTGVPNITYNTAEGPTAWEYILEWTLQLGAEPVSVVA
jgi:hypothetical protein